jgi:hypothetical protein
MRYLVVLALMALVVALSASAQTSSSVRVRKSWDAFSTTEQGADLGRRRRVAGGVLTITFLF